MRHETTSKTTRRALKAENLQLRSQLAATSHETRQGLKAKLAEAREKAKALELQNSQLSGEVDTLKARLPASGAQSA